MATRKRGRPITRPFVHITRSRSDPVSCSLALLTAITPARDPYPDVPYTHSTTKILSTLYSIFILFLPSTLSTPHPLSLAHHSSPSNLTSTFWRQRLAKRIPLRFLHPTTSESLRPHRRKTSLDGHSTVDINHLLA